MLVMSSEDIGTADTERPAPRGVLVVDDVNERSRAFASLIDATTEPPVTPSAIVVGGGVLLATSSDESAVWIFTAAGRDRIADEAHGTLARDNDHVLSILLAEDFAMVGE